MTLAKLEHWTNTAYGLHRGALLLGAVQRLTQAPRPAYLELGLQVRPHGLTGGVLPAGGRLMLNLASSSLVYGAPSGFEIAFPLNGHSQAAVFEDLFSLLAEWELADVLPRAGSLFERVARGITSKGGRYRPPARETLLDETPLEIHQQTARSYADVLEEIFAGIARFRARFSGLMTPLVVWPEHFDLSTLWFAGNEIDESQPHTSFGFAPYSPGIPYPYLYAYAYPYPYQYDPPVLPEGARWHTEGWTGAVLPYDVLAAQPDTAGFVEASCESIFAGLMPLLTT